MSTLSEPNPVVTSSLTSSAEFEINLFDQIIVDTLVDENDGDLSPGDVSLREAIAFVNSGGTVNFNPGLANQDAGFGQGTIGLTLGQLSISKNLSINGLGSDLLTVDAGRLSRVFLVDDFNSSNLSNVSISDLTISGGLASGGNFIGDGAGVFNQEKLILTKSVISNNESTNVSGGVFNSGTLLLSNSIVLNNIGSFGAGVRNVFGNAQIINSTITGNIASEFGGGIDNFGGTLEVINTKITNNIAGRGGGIGVGGSGSGVVTVTNSTISGNTAQIGGGVINNDTIIVANSEISSNTSEAQGGGIASQGPGILTVDKTVISNNRAGSDGGGIDIVTDGVISNSLIVGNTALRGGGIGMAGNVKVENTTITNNSADFFGGGINNYVRLEVINTTITENSALGNGSGIHNVGTAQVENSIVAQNAGNKDVYGLFGSQGYNLVGNGDGSTGFGAPGDQVGTTANPIDPKLGPLQDNGGPTFTQALLSGSPAVNAANPNNFPATDQRGVARPQGAAPDIGAFELESVPSNPITGYQPGTNGPDVFSGQVTLTSPPADLFGAAIVDAFIDARGGDDVIEGTATVTSSGTQNSLTLNAAADAYVRTDLDVRRNDNYGLDRNMNVGTSRGGGGIPDGGPDAERSLLKFDLSGISGSIKNARLELSILGIGGGTGSSEFNVAAHRILGSWTEGNGQEFPFPSTVPGAVWVDPADGVAWAGAGDNPAPDAANNQTQPSFDPTATAVTKVTQGVNNRGDLVEFDITSLVQGWVNGAFSNYGLMLIDPSSDGTFRELGFGTREGDLYPDAFPDEVTGPRLVIEFEAAAGTAEAVGVVSSLIDAGTGDDTLSFSATATGFNALAYGVKSASVLGGCGEDTITISSEAIGQGISKSVGVYQAYVDGGKGNDEIAISGTSTGTGVSSVSFSSEGSGTGYGLYQASVNGGNGNDTFTISGTGTGTGGGSIGGGSKGSGTGYGVSQASLEGGSSHDIITITGSGTGIGGGGARGGAADGNGTGYGVSQASVEGGSGHDSITISGTGTGTGGGSFFGSGADGSGTGYGVSQASVEGGSGHDSITISGIGTGTGGPNGRGAAGDGSGTGYGVYQASVDGGSGNDSITINGSGSGTGGSDNFSDCGGGGSGTGYGIFQTSIDGGHGHDSITISGTGTGTGGSSSSFAGEGSGTGYGVYQSSVTSGDDKDVINISGTASASGGTATATGYGVNQASVDGGYGNDSITIFGAASITGTGTATAYGVYQSSVNGGSGNDILNISSTTNLTLLITGGFTNPANGHIYFLTDPAFGTSWINAEAQAVSRGGHLVTINDATEQAWLNSTFNTLVNFGDSLVRESFWIGLYDPQGDNTDEWVSGESVTYTNWAAGEPNSAGEKYGELNPVFAPDQWNDRSDFPSEIGGRGIVEIVPQRTIAYGVYQSSVYGGSGNDTINISGTNFGIKEALVSGGEGNDTFKTGTGQGTIDGGQGNDLILLDFFNATTMTMTELSGNGLQIVGSQDNQGNAETWVQTILNMEQFQVGSNLFGSAEDVVNFLQNPT